MSACRAMRLVACLLAGLLCFVAAQAASPARAPQLVVQTLDGHRYDLAAQRGHWVIVNFWATWCSPCIAEMPEISRYVAAHKNVRAIGLAWDRSPHAAIVAFAKKHPVAYPLAQVDVDKAPGGFEPPPGLPLTYLIAPDGHVAQQFVGPVNAKLLDAAIAAARVSNGGN